MRNISIHKNLFRSEIEAVKLSIFAETATVAQLQAAEARHRNILEEIRDHQAKLSKDYQEWFGRAGESFERQKTDSPTSNLENLKKWVGASDWELMYQEALDRRASGTCEWLSKNSAVGQWARNIQKSVISGHERETPLLLVDGTYISSSRKDVH